MKIIAEIGSNWATYHDCIESIALAKQCGADAVKFQFFDAEDLYGPNAHTRCTVNEHAMSHHWIPDLKSVADSHGIEFMCTAFSEKGYRFINPFVQNHKVASSEMNHIPILRLLNEYGKPVYLSTAGASLEQIEKSLNYLNEVPITIMYCVGQYPAKLTNFKRIEELAQFKFAKVGLSDHTLDMVISDKLQDLDVVEKHVDFVGSNSPDSGHSLSGEEFEIYVKSFREDFVGLDEAEEVSNRAMNNLYRRRFIVTENLKPGDVLVYGVNVGLFRPVYPSAGCFDPYEYFGSGLMFKTNKAKYAGETILKSDIDL